LNNLYSFVYDCLWFSKKQKTRKDSTFKITEYQKEFKKAINEDLNTPQALAVLWNLSKEYYEKQKNPRLRNGVNLKTIYKLIIAFNKVLGLGLDQIKIPKIPQKVKNLVEKREQLRQKQNFKEADKLREEIQNLSFLLQDTPWGLKIKSLNTKY